jgi:hypothetical protein
MKTIALLAAVVAATGCTDASLAHLSQFNDPAEVKCYSGGQVIYHGTSTGKIGSNGEEDGLYFKEKESGKFVRLYADCIVRAL